MAGLLDFAARFGTEERCIEHLAGLRWPGGFVCSGYSGRAAWRLKLGLAVLRPELIGSPRPPMKVSSASRNPRSSRVGSSLSVQIDTAPDHCPNPRQPRLSALPSSVYPDTSGRGSYSMGFASSTRENGRGDLSVKTVDGVR
jgi:hypothetical protein